MIALNDAPGAKNDGPIRIALTGFLALAIAMGVGRFAFTPMLPVMQIEGLLSISGGGVLASLHFVGYWLGAVIATQVALPSKQTFNVSIFGISVATIGMGLTDSYWIWLAYRVSAGVCSAFILVLVSDFVVKRLSQLGHAQLQGFVFAGVGAGIVVVGLAVLTLMIESAGSAVSWQVVGSGTLVGAVIVLILKGGVFNESAATAILEKPHKVSLQWGLLVAYGVVGAGYAIPAVYLPVIAREAIESPFVFGFIWPVFGVTAFISTLFSMRLYASFTNRQIWATGQIVMAAAIGLSGLYPHIVTAIIAGACVGGTFMIVTMAGMREAHRLTMGQDVRRHIAALTAAFATGQIVGPFIAAWTYNAVSGFAPVLVVTSLCLGISAIGLKNRRELPKP
jgi:MFS family permease